MENKTSFDIYVNDLPDEVLVRCFSYLDVVDLLNASETCILWYAVSCDNEAWKSAFLKTYGNRKMHMKKGKRKQLQNQAKLPYRERYILEYHKDEQREKAAQVWLARLTPRPIRTTSGTVVNSVLISRALEQHAKDLELRRKKKHTPNGGPQRR